MPTAQPRWFANDGTEWPTLQEAEDHELHLRIECAIGDKCPIPKTVAAYIMACFSREKIKELLK